MSLGSTCTVSYLAVWSCEAGLHIDLIDISCGHAALGFLGFPDLQGLQPNTSHNPGECHATATCVIYCNITNNTTQKARTEIVSGQA